MAKQRARLTDDNDPLTSTDSVFASLEQAGKSASQQADNITSQQVRDLNVITSQQVNKPARQQVERNNANQATSQPVSLSASQKADKSAIRKSTFQLSEEILKQLDRYHLHLQLELGKADAPYKEVIVEEAIAQFLVNADPKNAIALLERQKTR